MGVELDVDVDMSVDTDVGVGVDAGECNGSAFALVSLASLARAVATAVCGLRWVPPLFLQCAAWPGQRARKRPQASEAGAALLSYDVLCPEIKCWNHAE